MHLQVHSPEGGHFSCTRLVKVRQIHSASPLPCINWMWSVSKLIRVVQVVILGIGDEVVVVLSQWKVVVVVIQVSQPCACRRLLQHRREALGGGGAATVLLHLPVLHLLPRVVSGQENRIREFSRIRWGRIRGSDTTIAGNIRPGGA